MRSVESSIMKPKSRRGDSNPRPHHYEQSSGSIGLWLVAGDSPASEAEQNEREQAPEYARKVAELRSHFASEGDVYFVQAGEDGPIKIGWSRDFRARVRGLQGTSPIPLRVLGHVPGDRHVERWFHFRFADQRLHGEWFVSTPFMRETIARLDAARATAEKTLRAGARA